MVVEEEVVSIRKETTKDGCFADLAGAEENESLAVGVKVSGELLV